MKLEEIRGDRVEDWKWVVLDVDGVLIDPSDSYDRAVKRTGELLLERLGVDGSFDLETVRSFRKKGKFGDDFKVTEGLILAHFSDDFEEFVSDFPRGEDLDWIRERVGEEIGRAAVKTRFDRFYFGDDSEDGLWKREEPLIDTALLDGLKERFSLGYVTGRSREEVELAEEILGYDLRNVVSRDEYHKPDPRALSSLVGGEDGVYVGDTYNDGLLVENYNREGNEFSFVLVDGEGESEETLEMILELSDR